jgi:hypothetical protein
MAKKKPDQKQDKKVAEISKNDKIKEAEMLGITSEEGVPIKDVITITSEDKSPAIIVESEDKNIVYSFPSRSRCPRCNAIDTLRVGVTLDGKYQKRQCSRAVCRKNYRIKGKIV